MSIGKTCDYDRLSLPPSPSPPKKKHKSIYKSNFIICSYAGGNWMALDGGKGGGTWNLETVIDLRQRSDTGQANSSPVTLSKPIY